MLLQASIMLPTICLSINIISYHFLYSLRSISFICLWFSSSIMRSVFCLRNASNSFIAMKIMDIVVINGYDYLYIKTACLTNATIYPCSVLSQRQGYLSTYDLLLFKVKISVFTFQYCTALLLGDRREFICVTHNTLPTVNDMNLYTACLKMQFHQKPQIITFHGRITP